MTQTRPRLRLGIIADPQYADLEPDLTMDRHFCRSRDKLHQAVEHFNGQPLDAVVVLGDLIDRGWENFAAALDILGTLHAPRILLPGNHDFLVEPDRLTQVHKLLSMPSPYHELVFDGLRLLVTDGTEISLFSTAPEDPRRQEAEMRLQALKASGAQNAYEWNAGISAAQAAWITERLSAAESAGEQVILLGHYPIYPSSDHMLWGAEELATSVVSSSSAIAYLCGHHHAGGHAERDGVHFVNFCGMVDTEHDNAFAVLTLFEDRIEIAGHGREPDRWLDLSPQKQRTAGFPDNSLTDA
ncbi:metallophosphoesterase [Rhizobium sp. AQ_MP]|uniref:metallophosphoesterase n=1 Tax=Rhizobium sp. AQ_MP TaxID=2761536 RepID=UPI00163A4762|nr:metallophosphoesterase [Rhizobium sp. AQ_MP]MBC2772999.1 metallophosphoesterase [Rhizobium sp. AQ_MP]